MSITAHYTSCLDTLSSPVSMSRSIVMSLLLAVKSSIIRAGLPEATPLLLASPG